MRTMERRIRKTKQMILGLQAAIDTTDNDTLKFELQQEYDRKSALLKKQNDAYRDYCSVNGAKTLNERVQIARWDRQQTGKASAAARRYKSG